MQGGTSSHELPLGELRWMIKIERSRAISEELLDKDFGDFAVNAIRTATE